jgi:acetyl esterase/lipase
MKSKSSKTSKAVIILCLIVVSALFGWTSVSKSPQIKPQQDSVERNVVYGSNLNVQGNTQKLDMDIYYPKNRIAGKRYPLVMMLHGGSFLNGRKESLGTHCKILADSGFVAVTINYRLGWNAASVFSGCDKIDVNSLIAATYRSVQDTHAAMRFLVANANKYDIDTKWLFIGGSSAGGFIALDMAYLTQKFAAEKMADAVATLGKLDTAGNKFKNSFKIKGILNMWGALPDSTLINKSTALPTIFFHGTADQTVPYDRGFYIKNCDRVPEIFGSACLYRQTLATGKPTIMNTSPNGKHDPKEFTAKVVASNTACFFHAVMQGKAQSGGYYNAIVGCR